MSKILRNLGATSIAIVDTGVTVAANSNYTIPPQDYATFAASSDTINYLALQNLTLNDGSTDVTNLSQAVDILKGWCPKAPAAVTVPNVTINIFNSITSVVTNLESTIVTYTVSNTQSLDLDRVEFSGQNIALYLVYIDGTLVASRRTMFGADLSGEFIFSGLVVSGNSTINVNAIHSRSSVANFEARIVGGLIG